METAWHPFKDELIDLQRYKLEFGPRYDELGRRRTRPPARCMVCRHGLYTVGEDLGNRDGGFAHMPRSGWCPVKETGKFKYAGLTPVSPDREAGRRLRSSFYANWRCHWGEIKSICQYPDILTLIAMLQRADAIDLWSHRDLPERHLPYILWALSEHPPNPWRPEWCRFFFDAKVRTLEDLWIRTTGSFGFFRADYLLREGHRTPKPDNLIRVEPVQVGSDYLIWPPKYAALPFQVNKMDEHMRSLGLLVANEMNPR